MTEYIYDALNDEGSHLRGRLEADSEDAVRAALLERGLMAVKISPASSPWRRLLLRVQQLRRVPLKEVILFSKQFRTLFNAGVSLPELLRILQNQTENVRLREAVADISLQVSEGQSLHSGFFRHGDIFPPLYCNMIRAGESSGSLGDVLDRLTYIMGHEDKVARQIASALRYPKMVCVAIAGAFLILLNMVVPQFASIFRSARLELPLPTRAAIWLNEAMSEYWWLCLGAVAGVWLGLRWWRSTETGRLFFDALFLRLPIVGPVVRKAMLARFAAIFSILQRSGITMLDSIDILAGTLNNAAVSREFVKVKEKLAAGQGLAEPLRFVRYFSPLAINMIAVGESTGSMDSMMDELARHYDEEVEFAVEGMTEAIGPLLLLGLGVVVLFFALAIFMPMWDMAQLATRM